MLCHDFSSAFSGSSLPLLHRAPLPCSPAVGRGRCCSAAHRSREGQRWWWWRWWCCCCHKAFVSPSPGLHVLLLHSAFHMQLYCIWLDARACCCRLVLSYWSEEKLPAEQRVCADISPASPVGHRITDSRFRLKEKMTRLLTGLQNQCKTKIYNHNNIINNNNNNNNNNRPGLEDLSIYCRASWVSPSGGVKAPLSLSASIHFSIH